MFKLNKKEIPEFFISAKKNVKIPLVSSAWNDTNIRNISFKLREHILLQEQELLCCYCETEIDSSSDTSNIDHFKTRHLFPRLTLEYDNLLISCNTRYQCSSFKDDKIKYKSDYDNIINPVIEDPDYYFDYLLTGDIFPKSNIDAKSKEKAIFTIAIFQLNNTRLVHKRKEVARSLSYLQQQYNQPKLSTLYNHFPDFKSFVKNIYSKIFQQPKQKPH